ncbi:membrane protein [Candidatus Magnetoovum chiemensis]|nr:membrane protein [Candidatus Magnetoovum chiemensis]
MLGLCSTHHLDHQQLMNVMLLLLIYMLLYLLYQSCPAYQDHRLRLRNYLKQKELLLMRQNLIYFYIYYTLFLLNYIIN